MACCRPPWASAPCRHRPGTAKRHHRPAPPSNGDHAADPRRQVKERAAPAPAQHSPGDAQGEQGKPAEDECRPPAGRHEGAGLRGEQGKKGGDHQGRPGGGERKHGITDCSPAASPVSYRPGDNRQAEGKKKSDQVHSQRPGHRGNSREGGRGLATRIPCKQEPGRWELFPDPGRIIIIPEERPSSGLPTRPKAGTCEKGLIREGACPFTVPRDGRSP